MKISWQMSLVLLTIGNLLLAVVGAMDRANQKLDEESRRLTDPIKWVYRFPPERASTSTAKVPIPASQVPATDRKSGSGARPTT